MEILNRLSENPDAIIYGAAAVASATAISIGFYKAVRAWADSRMIVGEARENNRPAVIAAQTAQLTERTKLIKELLADPNYQSYLDKRIGIRDEVMESRPYSSPMDVEEHIEATLGMNPVEDLIKRLKN